MKTYLLIRFLYNYVSFILKYEMYSYYMHIYVYVCIMYLTGVILHRGL